MDPREWSAVRILCEAQGVDMHLFLFAGSQKSARGFSKFEIAAAGPSHCEAAKKCSAKCPRLEFSNEMQMDYVLSQV